MFDMAELLQRINRAMDETPAGESAYAREILLEQQVLPSLSGLPAILRQFVVD